MVLPSYNEDKGPLKDDYIAAFKEFVNGTFDDDNWVITDCEDPLEEILIKGDQAFTFEITYKHRLAAGESTTAVFEEILIFPEWDHDELQMHGLLDGGFTIDVFAEAIQAEGFTDTDGDGFIYDEAFAAFDAQMAVTE